MQFIKENEFVLICDASASTPLTNPSQYFIKQTNRTIHLFYSLVDLADSRDKMIEIIMDKKEMLERIPAGEKSINLEVGWKVYVQEQLPVLFEMIFCRMVDNFLT